MIFSYIIVGLVMVLMSACALAGFMNKKGE